MMPYGSRGFSGGEYGTSVQIANTSVRTSGIFKKLSISTVIFPLHFNRGFGKANPPRPKPSHQSSLVVPMVDRHRDSPAYACMAWI
jgi:hypothetical protein